MSYGHLQVSPIGNCSVSALVDGEGRFVWGCLPRVDGDPAFSALLSGKDPNDAKAKGVWSIKLEDQVHATQEYERNTAILRTVLTDMRGASLEIIERAGHNPQDENPDAVVESVREFLHRERDIAMLAELEMVWQGGAP